MELELALKRMRRRQLERADWARRSVVPFGPEAPLSWRVRRVFTSAKRRAAKNGIPFTIGHDDVLTAWPRDNRCPITRLPFSDDEHPAEKWRLSSIDRLRPSGGYVPGNIAIISLRANTLKNNITDPELFQRLADWMRETVPTRDGLFS